MQDLVSIVIPCYNSESTVLQAIKSIEQQTYKSIEVIIVDDGSTDNTYKMILEYKKKSSMDINIIRQEHYGVSISRNVGIYNSNGKYIAFLDADDQYESEFLQVLLNALIRNKVDIAICQYSRKKAKCDIKLEDISERTLKREELIDIYIHKRINNISFFCGLYKKNIIVQNKIVFPPNLKYGEDTEFICKYIACCNNGAFLSIPLYWYSNNENSVMHKIDYQRTDSVQAYYNVVEFWSEKYGIPKWEDYVIARIIWAITKDFAIDDKLYKRFIKEYNVRESMQLLVTCGDEMTIRISAFLYLINPILFRLIIKLKK